MLCVSAKAGLVPEESLGTLCLGLSGNGREDLALPFLDGFRVTLVGSLQRLLCCQPESREKFAARPQNGTLRYSSNATHVHPHDVARSRTGSLERGPATILKKTPYNG